MEQQPVIQVTDQALADSARAALDGYELPTGYVDEAGVVHKQVVVREITGEEEDMLMARKMPVHQKMQKLLEVCTLQIGDVKQGHPQWSKIVRELHVTDRFFLILKIRIVSLGKDFSYKAKCPECEEFSSYVVNLDDIHIVGLKDPKVRTWRDKLPSGKEFLAKAQTGVEEEKLAKVVESKDMASLLLLGRLIELDGKQPVTLDMVKKLNLADRNHLRKLFETQEGEIDNELEMTCKECSCEFKTAVEVGTPNFFFPSAT